MHENVAGAKGSRPRIAGLGTGREGLLIDPIETRENNCFLTDLSPLPRSTSSVLPLNLQVIRSPPTWPEFAR